MNAPFSAVAIVGILALGIFPAGCNSSTTPQGTSPGTGGGIAGVDVEGHAAFSDGSPIPDQKIELQLVVDGANLFHPGPGGCTQTPAHIAGTTIQEASLDSSGGYRLSVPIGQLRAAVIRACVMDSLQPAQVEGLRVKASILADATSCPAFCAASSDPSSDCVSDCSTGNRTIDAAATLDPTQVAPVLASQTPDGVIHWPVALEFSQLGPSLAAGAGPDLVVDGAAAQESARVTNEDFTPDSCEVAESCVRAAGTRRLLRFDGTIENLGTSDLVIGDPSSSPLFQNSSCHHVPLLSNIMLYELIDPRSGAVVSVDGQDIVGRKQGFCMMDISQVNASAPEGQYDCNNQGITAGWADVYDSDLDCQYLDITGVASGTYVLRLTVNPDGIFQESDTSNNTAEIEVGI